MEEKTWRVIIKEKKTHQHIRKRQGFKKLVGGMWVKD